MGDGAGLFTKIRMQWEMEGRKPRMARGRRRLDWSASEAGRI
jgi:hypothetical protein